MSSASGFPDYLPKFDPLITVAIFVSLLVVFHLIPFISDPHRIRSYPGPFLAKFSDAWLGWIAARGHIIGDVHEAHRKYGRWACP